MTKGGILIILTPSKVFLIYEPEEMCLVVPERCVRVAAEFNKCMESHYFKPVIILADFSRALSKPIYYLSFVFFFI